MNFNHLHHFYVVVREGGVSAASRKLRISQPSLSAQIKCFEGMLGVSLFERKGNRLELTSMGKAIYSNAAKMFEISSSIPDIVSKKSDQGATFKLGIADEIERPFAVNLVKTLFRKWPSSELPCITFMTGLNEDLFGKLRSWALDAVITNRPSSYEDLEIVGTIIMPVYLAVGINSKMKLTSAINCGNKEIPAILEKKKYISLPSPRLKLREEIDFFLSGIKSKFPISFESDTLATVIRAIIDDVGAGFVPLPYITREVQRKEAAVFGPEGGLWKHSVFLMMKSGRGESSGAREISEAFEDLKADVTSSLSSVKFSGSAEKFIREITHAQSN